MDLRAYLRAFQRNWWVLLVAVLLGGGLGAFAALASTPMYSSYVTFFVRTNVSPSTSLQESNQYAQQRVPSYAALITSDRLAAMVLAKTGADISQAELKKETQSTADVDTVLLTATVTDPSPSQSLKLATGISTEFVAMLKSIDPAVTPEVVSGPTLVPDPVSPKKSLYVGLGIAAGLAMGLCIAVMRETLDSTIRSAANLALRIGIPDLGQIPRDTSAKSMPLVTQGHAHSKRAEALRHVRTNLQFTRVDNPPQVIVVTSALPNEGKTTNAINLAIILAETNRRVLLVEGDLRRPRLSEYMDIERSVGLTNLLAGQVQLEDVVQHWGSDALSVLPGGSIPPNPSELLGSENMAAMVRAARREFDLIVIDAPPILPVTDAAVLSRYADGVILVFRYGITKVVQAAAAVTALQAVEAPTLGFLLNMTPAKTGRAYSAYLDLHAAVPEADVLAANPAGHDEPSLGSGEVSDRDVRSRHAVELSMPDPSVSLASSASESTITGASLDPEPENGSRIATSQDVEPLQAAPSAAAREKATAATSAARRPSGRT